jgi:hypothetical protein
MRRAAVGMLALGLSACASAPLMLPEDPLEKAAACTAVRTLELRAGKAQEGPVTFAGFTEILHFAMIHAAEDAVAVDRARLDAVRRRAGERITELEDQNWASLVEPCNQAFPETQKDAPALAADSFEAGMSCYALADFLAGAAAAEFPDEQRSLVGIAERALAAAQPVLRQRARDDEEARRIAEGYAARAFKAGRPTSLIGQCRRRFPARS